jgi:glutathione S-transferase
MKLYYVPDVCSLSPHIVSREAGIPLELKKVDRTSKLVDGALDYHTKNPMGYVPALELDDGNVLTEGAVIVQYLADQRPDAGLIPRAGTFERYRLLQWLNFVATEVHKGFSPLFRPLPEEFRKPSVERLSARLAHLDKVLATQPYIMGERFTVVDAYLYTVLRWHKRVNLDLATWPNVKAHFERVQARPKVKEALEAEGLSAL